MAIDDCERVNDAWLITILISTCCYNVHLHASDCGQNDENSGTFLSQTLCGLNKFQHEYWSNCNLAGKIRIIEYPFSCHKNNIRWKSRLT